MTLKTVAKLGYEVVEFYSPYFKWTPAYTKDVRAQMDDLGLRCYSTHNGFESFTPGENLAHAIELNQILGTRYIVLASAPGRTSGVEGWKHLCEQLSSAVEQLKPHGLSAGYHNHQAEWAKLENGQRIIEVIAANTPKEFVLQLDVGTCEEAGADPVAWVKANPGRIKVMHLKDWAPGDARGRKRLSRPVRRGRHALERAPRHGGIRRRRRVFSDRAGRQPVIRNSKRPSGAWTITGRCSAKRDRIKLSRPMKRPITAIGISLILGCLTQAVILNRAYGADRKPAPTRLPTEPGTPALIPAGPNAEALARAAQKNAASTNDAATNPTEAMPGANPPPNLDGNFLIGPAYVQAPELSVTPGVPQGRVQQFSMDSTDSKFYPGIARNAPGTVDPNNPKTLIVETHPAPYTRTITVYTPQPICSRDGGAFHCDARWSAHGQPGQEPAPYT